jgi:predicted PurR-regulated permease PerM
VITLGAVFGLILAFAFVIPLLVEQLTALVRSAPTYFAALRDFVLTHFPTLDEPGGAVRRSIEGIGELIRERGAALANQVVSSLLGIVNALLFIVVVPVVAFYMLLDWDRMVASLDELLPREHAPTIRRLASEIDGTLASFVRGQLTVCLILGTFYAVSLMVVGLQFGLVVGAIAGLITFIPYVGAIVGGALAIGLALFQFWGEWAWIAVVGGIFVAGQFLEGNILTPKLVGGSVGLHPVWLLFALAAFGSIYGFVGMLVAVPVAAALGVITRFLVREYKASRLYTGEPAPPPFGTPPPEAAPEIAPEADVDAPEPRRPAAE